MWIALGDRKSTRLNSSHITISYAVFCLKKKRRSLNSSHITVSYAGLWLNRDVQRDSALVSAGARAPPLLPLAPRLHLVFFFLMIGPPPEFSPFPLPPLFRS